MGELAKDVYQRQAVCNYRQVDEALTPIREQYLHVRREVLLSLIHI